MCGINGAFEKHSTADTLERKTQIMNECIVHRGPDDAGIFALQEKDYSVSMGMQRLAIIDLASGQQPIYSDDHQKVIVFNGEIYNFKFLKDELMSEGVSFKTNSDTEVILKLYENYGVDSFARLDGMFAFSIYDKTIDAIFIARDYFGEKPLYYTLLDDRFYWSSELKSMMEITTDPVEISTEGLNLFFQLTYIPAPFTIYKNIHKLEANSYLKFDCSTSKHEIFEIKQNFKKYKRTDKKTAIQVNHDLIQESVLSRSVSDVPLGAFLSGGVDSSIISLIMSQQSSSKIDTFSIGFEKQSFDETDKSREVANLIGSNHHEFVIGEKDLADNLEEILLNFDEPFADSSALATYVVANKTSSHVKLALTGDGGDEVYGGYNKYYMARLNQKYTSLIPKALHEMGVGAIQTLLQTKSDSRGKRFKLNRLLKAIDYEGEFYYGIISLGFQPNELPNILQQEWLNTSGFEYYKNKIGDKNKTLTDFRNIDQILSLEGDMLVKVDRTSMLASLECRAPFLNKELWNFTQQLPESYLINGWDKKHILKESFKQYFPKGFLDKSKKGFGVPVGDWLRTSLKDELYTYIDKTLLEDQGIFDINEISKLVEDHIKAKKDNTFRVWTYYCFQKWYVHTYKKHNIQINNL